MAGFSTAFSIGLRVAVEILKNVIRVFNKGELIRSDALQEAIDVCRELVAAFDSVIDDAEPLPPPPVLPAPVPVFDRRPALEAAIIRLKEELKTPSISEEEKARINRQIERKQKRLDDLK